MTAALERVSGQQHALAALYPRERPGTHFTGGWVGSRAGLDGRKISSPPGFDPATSSPQSVAIPTELPGQHHGVNMGAKAEEMEFEQRRKKYLIQNTSVFVFYLYFYFILITQKVTGEWHR